MQRLVKIIPQATSEETIGKLENLEELPTIETKIQGDRILKNRERWSTECEHLSYI